MNQKHGIYLFLKHNQLPSIRGRRKVQKILTDLESGLVAELGGWDKITPQQEMLVRATVKCYGVILLTELFVNKYSPLRPDLAKRGVLAYQPVLERSYLSFLNSARLNLAQLFPDGLQGKKADDALDLGRYLKEHYGDGKGDGQGKASEEGKKGDPGANREGFSGSQGEEA